MSCGMLGMTTVLIFLEVGGFVFKSIRGVNRGWIDEAGAQIAGFASAVEDTGESQKPRDQRMEFLVRYPCVCGNIVTGAAGTFLKRIVESLL